MCTVFSLFNLPANTPLVSLTLFLMQHHDSTMEMSDGREAQFYYANVSSFVFQLLSKFTSATHQPHNSCVLVVFFTETDVRKQYGAQERKDLHKIQCAT